MGKPGAKKQGVANGEQQPTTAGALSLGPLIAKPGRDTTNTTTANRAAAAAAAAAGGGGGGLGGARRGRPGSATTAAAGKKGGDLDSVRALLDASIKQAHDSMVKQMTKLDNLLQSHVEAAYKEGDKHRTKTVGYLEEASNLMKQVQGAHSQNMHKLKEYSDQTAGTLNKNDASLKKDLDAVKQGALQQLAALKRRAGING